MTTLWAARGLTDDGWTEPACHHRPVGPHRAVAQGAPAPADHRVGILLPAPANAHSHAFQRAMAG
jgi:formimidoylglutamate deiminase